MANIESKKKTIKQDSKRNLKNKSLRSEVKTAMKKANNSKKIEDINHAISLINKGITAGIFHKNKASRLNSKMHLLKVN